MTDNRIAWKEYFMAQAKIIAMRSTCPRAHVGAIITKDNQILATGYNGSVKGAEHCSDVGCLIRDGHCVRTIHAEINAVIQAAKHGVTLEDATIYVTHFPCYHCTKAIVQAGVRELFYEQGYRMDEEALKLLSINDITYTQTSVSLGEIEEAFAETE
jgi:dCMP deaminase